MDMVCVVCEESKPDCIEHTLGGLIVCATCRQYLYVERAVLNLIITKAREIRDAENP